MALGPLKNALVESGIASFQLATPFRVEADTELAGFQSIRAQLEAQVRRGDLTLKAARERAHAAARQLRERLTGLSQNYSPTSPLFQERLVAVSEARQRARQRQGGEGLSRENNRLLRELLVELQLVNRRPEFEGRTFKRPLQGGAAAPTLESLLEFHEWATLSGDAAAREWARRQLETMRSTITTADAQKRIDRATDRPDRWNPRVAENYLETLRSLPPDRVQTFIKEAVEECDTNACVAAFLMAREAPEGPAAGWVRDLLDALVHFPDAALDILRQREAESRRADAEAARAAAEFTATVAEAEARFPELQPPSDAELSRQAEIRARPIAAPSEPIGLNLARRGTLDGEVGATNSDPCGVSLEPTDLHDRQTH